MFSDNLKKLRKNKGLTQIQFAKEFNISSGTIAMWETGKREPDLDTIKRIAKFFGVSTDRLISYEEEWDKAAEEFEKESQNDAKMLMNYLSKLFDDAESVRIAYDLIISLARLNRNGLLELSKMLDIFSRADEYKSDSLKEVEKLNEI